MGQFNGGKQEAIRKASNLHRPERPEQCTESTINYQHNRKSPQLSLTGAEYFSKLDAKLGFWQMPLDEENLVPNNI